MILSLLAALIITTNLSAQNFSKVENPPQPFGLNMAGADFGKNFPGVYNKDYTYPTAANLDYVKSKGFRLIRLPFKWDRIQHQLNGELEKEELARLRYVVDEAAKREILVLFDLHNYGRRYLGETRYRIGEGGLEIEHLADLWGKITKEFSEYSNIWGYGLMNEPNNMLESTPWSKIAQASILAIRNHDTKNAIVVGGDSWSSAERWMQFSDNLKNLYDPANNLIFEAHVYFDNDASGTYKKSYEEEKANPYKGIERVQPFIKWLRDNNFRGFIG
ncbi:MAG: cellulase family glycosylhydrolase, partial [Proteiniphilum sp.]